LDRAEAHVHRYAVRCSWQGTTAHRECYIANSLKTRITLEPEIVYAAAPPER
jgi:hypothetical protein